MTVESEAIAVGAFLFVAILTWNKIQIWNRMRALETRLEIIQKQSMHWRCKSRACKSRAA